MTVRRRRLRDLAAIALLAVAGAAGVTSALSSSTDGSLDVRLVGETATVVTLAWTPPADAAGYVFVADGVRVSRTFDPARAAVRFARGPARFEVLVLKVAESGSWPPPTPPDTTTTTTTTPAATGWDAVVAALPQLPAFTPTRTIAVTDATSLRAALTGLRAGDLVRATAPFTVTGQTLFIRSALTARAVVDLHGVTIRTATAGTLEHAVAVVGAQNVWITGGDISTRGNTCVWLQDTVSVTWRDVDVHDCAGTGIIAQGITRAQTGLDLHARVWNAGTDYQRLDPHAEKGTGIHGVYLGGANFATSGRFALDVRDQPVGAAVQAGAHLERSELAIRARRITFQARSQVAGNALQLWGSNRTVNVTYLEAEDVARAVETDGLYGDASGIVVGADRKVTRARLPQPFRSHPAVTYR